MFLTHLVESHQSYKTFAKNFKGYKILDNSLIEIGRSIYIERVYNAALAIAADEIILPDVFRDGPATLTATWAALEKIKKLEETYGVKFKKMAVAQGKTLDEFTNCFNRLSRSTQIDVIGIPKVVAKMLPQGRPGIEYLWQNSEKDIHLLGIWYSFEELGRFKYPEKIRSVDTCLASYFVENHMPIDSTRADGFTIDLEMAQIDEEEYKKCQMKF